MFYAITNDTILVRVAGDGSHIPELRVSYIGTIPVPSTNILLAVETNAADFVHEYVVSMTNSALGWYQIDCTAPGGLFVFDTDTLNYSASILRMPNAPLSYADTDVGPILSGESIEGSVAVGADLDAATFGVQSPCTVLLRLGQQEVRLVPALGLFDPNGQNLTNGFPVEYRAELSAELTSTGTYTVVCSDTLGQAGNYSISMVQIPGAISTNDADVGTIRLGEILTGTINKPGDMDVAMFEVSVGDTVTVTMVEVDVGIDPVMKLYDPEGALLATARDPLQQSCIITNEIAATGVYYVVCMDAEDRYNVKYSVSLDLVGGPSTNLIPVAPSNIRATDGAYDDRVAVSWSPVTNAANYQIWRHTSNDTASATNLYTTSYTNYDDMTVTPGLMYYYWVKAGNDFSQSGFSSNDTGWRALSPPAAVSASDGAYTSRVLVNWEAMTGASGYTVWRNTNDVSGSATSMGGTVSTNYEDTTGAQGASYYYWIKATNALGESGFSESDSGWRGLPPPGEVTASDGVYENYVLLSWSSVTNATSYGVYRNTSNNSATAVSIASTANTNYQDSSAAVGMLYYYWIKAGNSLGSSAFSAGDTGWRGVPMPPAGVTASDGAYTDMVVVNWQSATGADGYTVWRNTVDDTGTAVNIGSDSGTSYDDTTAALNTLYYYWVKATNVLGGTSAFSAGDDGWRGLTPPAGVTASDGAYTDKVAVSWQTTAGAAVYSVWRNTTSAPGSATELGFTAGTNYDDTTASPDKLYYYWVKAANFLGSSAFSGTDAGWRAMPPPTGISASDGTYTNGVMIN